MDSVTLAMFGFSFIITLVFSILGITGAVAERKHPLDAIWNFIAMLSWFFFAYLNIGFATDTMFYTFSYWYIALGLIFMCLGWYCLFVNLHISSGQREVDEMQLE